MLKVVVKTNKENHNFLVLYYENKKTGDIYSISTDQNLIKNILDMRNSEYKKFCDEITGTTKYIED